MEVYIVYSENKESESVEYTVENTERNQMELKLKFQNPEKVSINKVIILDIVTIIILGLGLINSKVFE
jgi:hypothetical protein